MGQPLEVWVLVWMRNAALGRRVKEKEKMARANFYLGFCLSDVCLICLGPTFISSKEGVVGSKGERKR